MAKQKIWNLMFVAGNPEIFTKVRASSSNPMKRSDALEAAEVIESNGWRGWVEHSETGKRIFETTVEREFADRK